MKRRHIIFIFLTIIAFCSVAVSCVTTEPVEDPEEIVDPDDPDNPDRPDKPDQPDQPDTPDTPGEYINGGNKYGNWYIKFYGALFGHGKTISVSPDGKITDSPYAKLELETNMSQSGFEPDTTSWLTVEKYPNGVIELTINGANPNPEDRVAKLVAYAIEGNVRCTDTLVVLQGGSTAVDPIDGIEYDVTPSTLVLSEKNASYITGVNDKGWYTLSDDVPSSLMSTSKNLVLYPHVSESCPEGLCGKVQFFDDNGKNYMRVQPVELEQVIRNLNITDHPVDLNSHVVKIQDASGTPLKFVKTKASGSDNISISIPKTTFRNWDQRIIVKAAVDLSLSMKMNLQIGDGRLDYFSMVLDPDVTLDLDMDANSSVPLVDTSYPFFTVLCGAFPVGPVVITPLIEFSFVIGAEGKIGIKGTVKYENNSGVLFVYQRDQGCTYSMRDHSPEDQKNRTELGSSVYMEGSISCGLDESIGLGVYGKILYVTAGIQERLKCTANINVDVEEAAKDPTFTYPTSLLFSTDVTLQGVAALKSLNKSLADVKTLEHPYRLDSLYMFPTIKPVVTDVNGRQATVELEVGHDLLLPTSVGFDLYAVDPNDPAYKWGEGICPHLTESHFVGTYPMMEHSRIDPKTTRKDENGNPVNVYQTTVPLYTQAGLYAVRPFIIFAGQKFRQSGFDANAVFYAESGCEDAFREILMDISRSIKNKPKSWTFDTPISGWQGVSISYLNPQTPVMAVDLKGTSTEGVITVGNHTQGMSCQWTLAASPKTYVDDPDPNVTGLDISDPSFQGWDSYLERSLQTLKLNVNSSSTSLASLMVYRHFSDHLPELATLELTGNNPWLTVLDLPAGQMPKLTKVSISGHTGCSAINLAYRAQLATVAIEEAEKIEKLNYDGPADRIGLLDPSRFRNLTTLTVNNDARNAVLTLTDLPKLSSVDVKGDSLKSISFEKCFTGAGVVYFNKLGYRNEVNTRALSFSECGMTGLVHDKAMDFISVSDCNKLESYDGGAKELHLTNLPVLESFYAAGCGMKSFELSNLPALLDFRMDGNPGLGRQLVPAIFDEVRLRRYRNNMSSYYNLHYDVVYQYYSPTHYSEGDYGFFYIDEPSCGYHWKPSRIGLSDDNKIEWP